MKTLGSNAATAFASDSVKVCAFAEFVLDSGTQRYTTLPYTATWNSQSWLGLGNLAQIDEIRETESLVATGVKITLSGVPASLVALILAEPMQSRICTIWFAALGSDNAVLDTPPVEFKGLIDTPSMSVDGGSATIVINVESVLADFARPNVRRYNDADHQAQYPGDLFFQFVPQMTERTIIWPDRQWFKDNA